MWIKWYILYALATHRPKPVSQRARQIRFVQQFKH